MAARLLVEQLHLRLADRGWPDVPPAAGYVLLAAREQPTTGREVAALMRTSKQAASKLLERLEADGLVERSGTGDDARVKAVALTSRGRQLLDTVEDVYRELEEEWAAVVGADAVEATRATVTAALVDAYGGSLPAVTPVT